MAPSRIKIFFDGGCRPNPGRIEAAVVLRGVVHHFDDCGSGTNSDAEWIALRLAVELAREARLEKVLLLGDALEIVREARSALAGAAATHEHARAFLAVAAAVPGLAVRWIKREQNLAGISLAARHPR